MGNHWTRCVRLMVSCLRKTGRWLIMAVAGFLTACGSGQDGNNANSSPHYLATTVTASAVPSGVSVQNLILKAERRITRTVFEYDYAIVLKNDGPALNRVDIRLVSVGPGTSIIDGNSTALSVPAQSLTQPSDLITVRHDRSQAFQLSLFNWTFDFPPVVVSSLPGSPSGPAIDAITEYDANQTFPDSELVADSIRGSTVLRSKVIFGFKLGTTVGQINTLLQSLQATIVRTYDRTAVLEVRIPDPGSLPALETVLTNLRANPVVSFALPTTFAPANALPTVLYNHPENEDYIANHLAVKGAAAWNARRAVQLNGAASPVFMIADYFGGASIAGAPFTNLTLVGASGNGFTPSKLDPHGYFVLGIAAGSFNGPSDASDGFNVTGMYATSKPALLEVQDLTVTTATCTLKIGNHDFCKGITIQDQVRSLLFGYKNIDRKIVLNTSLGFNQAESSISETEAIAQKLYWLYLIRGGFGTEHSSFEDRFFHSASAGNNSALPAARNIGWTRAAIDGDLTNTAVVENREAGLSDPFAPGCLHEETAVPAGSPPDKGSSYGGNISAIGTEVRSYTDTVGGTGVGSGTSASAPQVAGLALYFWAIRNDFSSSQLLDIIREHAIPELGGCPRHGQPLIDAYATVLAADDPDALLPPGDPKRAPVRVSILDLDQDNYFTFSDTKAFVDAFVATKGGSAYTAQVRSVGKFTYDLSRFDLNGDGTVGGAGTSRFNLNIDYGAKRKSIYGTVTFSTLSDKVVSLDENAVTDFQILCYYIYSKLFDERNGTIADVESYLAQNNLSCVGPLLSVELKINDTFAGWGGLPATIGMTQFYNVTPTQFQIAGNSATCGNQGLSGGERGSKLFSLSVDSDAVFMGARAVTGVPYQLSPGSSNRNNCSSFFAYKSVTVPGKPNAQGKFWINATARVVSGFGIGIISDWEYQVRYFSGDPLTGYSDKKVTVGLVPNSGFYQTAFVSTSNSFSYIFGPPVQ